MMGKGSINHNTRAFSAKNVDVERSIYNVEFCHAEIEEVYHELFDEALERYNAKQKRSDRKIDNYYEKIRQGKQEKLFHEAVFQIGNRDDMNAKSKEGELAKEILIEFMKDFQKRNPYLHVFSAHLHMDEETPHIHVTLVPIVKGERKRRKREEQTKKRYRKKPTDTVRLCADDIMTRLKLKSYQDTYAEAMAKYGLQRGIDGSKARHKSTQQYYRDIQKLADNLKAEVVDLQQQKETAREELRRAKKEIQTEKLKGAATVAAANIAESVGSLFGSNKVKTLERENTALHREVADHEEIIEALQDRIQTMQADHSREIREMQRKHGREIADKETKHKEEISFLKTVIARAAAWFPYFREMLRIENLCRLIGFDERQTATLVKGKPLEYAGELYSEEHGRKFTTEKAGFQVVKDPTDGTRLVLAIDRKPIAEWFKEQYEKLRQNIRRPIQPQRKSRGI